MTVDPISREIEQLMILTRQDRLVALELVEKQLNTLYSRAQVLMSLAGVVVTVTGFSGRGIAGSSLIAQILVIAGLMTVLTSAVWVYGKVMGIRWITSDVEDESTDFLRCALRRRNRKTAAFAVGGKILFWGLFLYATAFALLLLNP
jgi:hypothetical protein